MYASQCGESPTTRSTSAGIQTLAVLGGKNNCIGETSFDVNKDDVVWFSFERDATNVADTIGDTAYALGFRVSYLGWK